MRRVAAVAAVSVLALGVPATAQSRVELFGGYQIPDGAVRGTFATDYVPLLVNGGTATGRGEQTLELQGGRPKGVIAGINWWPRSHAGVQLFVSRAAHSFSGANTPSRVQLTYLSRQPPDYIEREFTYDRSFDWPDTEGDFALWRVGANGVVRVGGRRADLTLSGGLLLSQVRGYFDRASYLEFRLGGHSTLFYEEALARLRLDDAWHAGYNAGAEVAVSAGRHVAITAGVRLMSAPPRDIAVTAEILNVDQMIFEVPLDRVREHIGTRPAEFSRWGTVVFTIGLRVR